MSTETEITSSLGEAKSKSMKPKAQLASELASCPMDLLSQEWWELQSNWLVSMIQAAMGDSSIPGILNFDWVHILAQPSQEKKPTPLPLHAFPIWYNGHVWFQAGEGSVLEFHNSLV